MRHRDRLGGNPLVRGFLRAGAFMHSSLRETNMALHSDYKNIENTARHASGQVASWIEPLARLGFAAKGLVYLVIGGLALQVAFGSGGKTTDARGALYEIANQPYGQILLGVVAVGLFAYALWRLVEAIKDPERNGTDAKAIVKRIGYAVSGLIHIALGVVAAQIVVRSAASSGKSAQDWTAQLMSQPFGRWLVGLVGLIVVGVGLYQFYISYKAKFKEHLKLGEMSGGKALWAERSGRLGYAARGVVYAIIGGFLIQAAIRHDPNQAGGLAEALDTLAQQPYGPWLLGVVALGLFAYGIFCMVEARYRRIVVR